MTESDMLAKTPDSNAIERSLRLAPGPAWHVVRSIGRTDTQVLDWLKRRDVETYYPVVREMRPVRRNKLSRAQRKAGLMILRPKLVPLFPKYYFVRLDLADGEWHELFRLGGLTGLVCAGGLPVRIGDDLVAALRGCEVDGAVPGTTPARVVFAVGDTVRVTNGPFAAQLATVERGIDVALQDIDGETRLTVAIELFGRATPVELMIDHVERV
ncbi:transcription termination/antitermination protein NusG [Blastochloris tepida]|uniref:Transcription termination/antitermination protein NusG n=2 Tax=Blastochloris tepida TaxID=2233851 RepID=A0A348G1D1_9HYPH|nr:transcription termination/antitermination protein NusG [Blastochloris tepida]